MTLDLTAIRKRNEERKRFVVQIPFHLIPNYTGESTDSLNEALGMTTADVDALLAEVERLRAECACSGTMVGSEHD